MTASSNRFPAEPFATGLLDVPGGHAIHWEMTGNPNGKPALFLHGGPGAPSRANGYRRLFDLTRYKVISIDQRGCGRSRPLAIDALDRLHENTTGALIADIEAVRRHLGLSRWLVSGVSWGTTLALAYAQACPEAVTALVLGAVTTTSREEVAWITEGVGAIFPEAWDQFATESACRDGERVVDAYARRLASGNPDDRAQAARAWCAWEDTHVSLSPNFAPLSFPDPEAARVFATLVTHYWSNDGFLRGGTAILACMDRLRDVPSILIHGRRDISSPARTAWLLSRSWPASRLHIVETEGHGGPELQARMQRAITAFATRA